MTQETFGQLIQRKRGELGLTLRAFCAKVRIDPSNLSKYERGVAVPSEDAVLRRLARGLNIPTRRGNPDWKQFQILASAARGEVPSDLLKNDRILAALPAFYQRLRDQGLPEGQDEVDALVGVLKSVM